LRTAALAGGGAALYHAGKNSGANQEAAAEAASVPPPAPAAPQESNIEQLKQLADLHSQGVLTDEEFAVQKAKLLNG
jgi:hypothetical protein